MFAEVARSRFLKPQYRDVGSQDLAALHQAFIAKKTEYSVTAAAKASAAAKYEHKKSSDKPKGPKPTEDNFGGSDAPRKPAGKDTARPAGKGGLKPVKE